MFLAGSTTRKNSFKITGNTLLKSDFYDALGGNGGKEFVHRDDVRRLLSGISSKIDVYGIVEDPDSLDREITRMILQKLFEDDNKDLVLYTENMKEKYVACFVYLFLRTFNSKDLSPSVITKEANKVFKWDSSKKEYVLNRDDLLKTSNNSSSNVNASANASFGIGPISIGGGASGSSIGSESGYFHTHFDNWLGHMKQRTHSMRKN